MLIEDRDRQTRLSFDDRPGDDCGRQSGGRFASGNDCASESGSPQQSTTRVPAGEGIVNSSGPEIPPARVTGSARTNTKNGFPAAWRGSHGFVYTGSLPGLEGVREITVQQPKEFTKAVKRAGFKSVADFAQFGCAVAEDSKVDISTSTRQAYIGGTIVDGTQVAIESDIAIDADRPERGRASVVVKLISYENGDSFAYYDYFQRDQTARNMIEAEKEASGNTGFSATEAKLGREIYDKFLGSLEAAEKAGVPLAKTLAAGSASDSQYRGYRLWSRFGFDADLSGSTRLGVLRDLLERNPGSQILAPDAKQRFLESGNLRLQELISTKEGERLWREHGGSVNMELDFTDKESIGYKRYRETLDRLRKAKSIGSRGYDDFIAFLSRAYICQSPSEWRGFQPASVESRYRDLIQFAEDRNCGTGSGGFQKGNTCAGGVATDVATGAAKGAASGGAHGAASTLGFPPAVIAGVAGGAAVGAVKGLYDNRMRPTRAARAIKEIGSSDEKVAGLVKGLGGSPKSVADADGKRAVTISVKDGDGKKVFDVRMTKDSITVSPARGNESLSKSRIDEIKAIAQQNHQQAVRVVVDKSPSSTLARLAKAGASIAYDATLGLVAGFVSPLLPAVAGSIAEEVAGEAAGNAVGTAVASVIPTAGAYYGAATELLTKARKV